MICSYCYFDLPPEAFPPSAEKKRHYCCLDCHRKKNRQYRNAHLEHARLLARTRMRAFRERINPPAERAEKKARRKLLAFWSKVQRGPGCWTWTACRNKKGYGSFHDRDGRTIGAHRFSWQLAYGAIPPNMNVLHRCDNPSCVRPDHLFLGTNQDNASDREEKGRGNQPCGARNRNAKLTVSDVQLIRTLRGTASQPQIARRFGVCQGTIWKILSGNSWRHVDL